MTTDPTDPAANLQALDIRPDLYTPPTLHPSAETVKALAPFWAQVRVGDVWLRARARFLSKVLAGDIFMDGLEFNCGDSGLIHLTADPERMHQSFWLDASQYRRELEDLLTEENGGERMSFVLSVRASETQAAAPLSAFTPPPWMPRTAEGMTIVIDPINTMVQPPPSIDLDDEETTSPEVPTLTESLTADPHFTRSPDKALEEANAKLKAAVLKASEWFPWLEGRMAHYTVERVTIFPQADDDEAVVVLVLRTDAGNAGSTVRLVREWAIERLEQLLGDAYGMRAQINFLHLDPSVVMPESAAATVPPEDDSDEPPTCPICDQVSFFGECRGCGYSTAEHDKARWSRVVQAFSAKFPLQARYLREFRLEVDKKAERFVLLLTLVGTEDQRMAEESLSRRVPYQALLDFCREEWPISSAVELVFRIEGQEFQPAAPLHPVQTPDEPVSTVSPAPAPEWGEDAMDIAWGLIANVSGGDWEKQSKDWQEAARDWEKRFYGKLSAWRNPPREEPTMREQYALAALPAVVASWKDTLGFEGDIASDAFAIADAMIKAGKEGSPS